MQFEHSITDYSKLLLQLMKKVLATDELKVDLLAAQKDFTGGVDLDNASANSFNEWYLLERDCPVLGAPPAVSFSPAEITTNDLWHCLHDSFFGLFHVTELVDGQANTAILECLWSARQIRVTTLPAGIDVGTLIPARVAQSDSESHLLLPAANFIIAPDLLESLAQDLRSIRGEQPRSRLSQQQWHQLFTNHQQSHAIAAGQSFEEALTQALLGQNELSVAEVTAMLEKHGAQDTLSQIAFDTDVDIEALRAAFALIGDDQGDDTAQLDDLDGDATQAISDFLANDSQGSNLDQAFGNLEQELSLEPGATGLLSEQSEPTGVDTLPGVEMWLRSYLFDCEAKSFQVSAAAGKEIEQFLNYCATTVKANEIDPHQLSAATVLAYMMGAAAVDEVNAKINHLDDFTQWLHREQDAPLESILPISGDETRTWLQQLVLCNQALQHNNVASSIAKVTAVSPLATLDEDGQSVMVNGFPSDYVSVVEVGDKLMGAWRDGCFVAGAWMPKRLLPTAD